MVKLDKIYTRSGDKGKTRLSTGEPVDKWHPRVVAYGTVDETNAALGVAALKADGDMLAAIRRAVQAITGGLARLRDRVLGQLLDFLGDHHSPNGLIGEPWSMGSSAMWAALLLAIYLLLYFS